MEVNHQATKEIEKSENEDHTSVSMFKDHSAFTAEQTNNELKNVQCNGVINRDTNSENKLTKPLLAFKWQKSCTKMKTDLQRSAAKAFSTVHHDDDLKKSKNRLTVLKNELSSSESTVAEEHNPYEEPAWSGIPAGVYKMDVLKFGVILKSLNLSYKSYHVIGTSLSCDITLSHETISEFHAVLQYRNVSDSENEKGVYIYDLNSTSGTFLNGVKVKPHTYIMIHGGDLVSFGNGQRKYVLHTPKDGEEQEAQLSATELQELQENELQEQQKLILEQSLKQNKLMVVEREESKGISWGIIDVDELSRSAVTSEYSDSDDDAAYLDNPKKALQDWFKWEGHDLEYQTEDEGFGRFSCCIDLTLDALGSTKRIRATAIGDQTKAIDECILKACKFLDDYGFLQRACREKKSTIKNWEAADYYDSDEDNFLDRTGVIEEKRQKRMKMDGKLKTQEMRDSLSEKYAEVCERIANLESSINLQKQDEDRKDSSEDDALDVFMTKLNTSSLSKSKIKDVKLELQNLYKERELLHNSINVNTSISQSKPFVANITEKTKNGCRFTN